MAMSSEKMRSYWLEDLPLLEICIVVVFASDMQVSIMKYQVKLMFPQTY